MPFENFYEESDKATQRRALIFFLSGILLCSFIIWLLSGSSTNEPPPQDELFTRDEQQRRVDDLCRYLPLPEQFFFTAKDAPKIYPNSTSIIYRYNSERSPEEIAPFFLMWFRSNGWKSIDGNGSIFRKDNQIVSLGITKPFHVMTGYEIQCTETE